MRELLKIIEMQKANFNLHEKILFKKLIAKARFF